MKSAIRMFRNATSGKPPVDIGSSASRTHGLSYSLGAGKQDRETFMRQYAMSGTLYGIVSLLAESTATPKWHLYKNPPADGRRRYATGDTGSDQRVEVVQHAAIQLVNNPNPFHSRFEFFEGAQQHEELTGETFWVLDTEMGFPTSMWYVRPDRMEPVPDPNDYLVGWIYTGPTGEQVPLKRSEVILEKRPDPMDPYRGAGPVQSIMPNIQQQRYATEYQRNLFLNGADPGGVITVPNRLNDREFDELIERWRESHRGVARAGHIGVLEDGMNWMPSPTTNKDMEYGNLRLANRDELREAWRIHKAMMGSSDDVNRANAQTAQEVFVAWQVLPRLNRRRDTFNSKLLPLFKASGVGVEFDYDDPSPVNAETAATELLQKSQAAVALVGAGFDPADVLEVVGLPDMDMGEVAAAAAPESPALPPAVPATPVDNRESVTISNAMRWEAVAHEDDHTCDACSANDGKLYRNREAAYADYPEGSSYVNCIGAQFGNSCRCTVRKRRMGATAESAPVSAKHDPAGKVYEESAKNFPASAIAWMHRASWKGPIEVPTSHINFEPGEMSHSPDDEKLVKGFSQKLDDGEKLDPVVLVATPKGTQLQMVDGHHRYLAAVRAGVPVRAYIATVDSEHGPWETMHDTEYPEVPKNSLRNAPKLSKASVNYREAEAPGRNCGTCNMFRAPSGCTLVKGKISRGDVCDDWVPKRDAPDAAPGNSKAMSDLLKRVLSDGYLPIETGGRT